MIKAWGKQEASRVPQVAYYFLGLSLLWNLNSETEGWAPQRGISKHLYSVIMLAVTGP